MNITIIGSFKKYYDGICDLIDIFTQNNVIVLSPRKSQIIKDIEGFVVLESDDKQSFPYMIQEHVFDNIRQSDCVYVWNPMGYLGNSTCFEIGKIIEMGKLLFFKEFPKDLPLKVNEDQIKDVDKFLEYIQYKDFS